MALWDGEDQALEVGGGNARTLLAVLVSADGRPVTPDAAIDAIWGESPPSSATGTLQSYVSRLRRVLPEDVQLTWSGSAYHLEVDPVEVDVHVFEHLADRGADALAAGRPDEAFELLTRGEALWRGPAFAGLSDREFAAGVAARLDERRLVATEDRLRCELALGRPDAAIPVLVELRREHPLRERLHELYALALYRTGRQAEALRALDEARTQLVEELGVEPGRALRELEQAILQQDPSLDAPAAATSAPRTSTTTSVSTSSSASSSVPVSAHEPSHGLPAPSPSPEDRFIGRTTELDDLARVLAESAASTRVVVIEGEPGIGKTRLADELLLRAPVGTRVLRGRADESGAAPALWPWLTPLRALASDSVEQDVALATVLDGTIGDLARPADAARFELFESVVSLVDRAARTTGVALLLDALQWADPASLALASHVVERVERGLFVVATVRPGERGRRDELTDLLGRLARLRGARRVVLPGLSADATAELIAQVSGGDLGELPASAILDRAEGNPFYAIELARLVGADGGAAHEVPSSVGDVVRRRLARLPDDTVELLGIGAVMGRDLDVELLSLAGDRELGDVLDQLDVALAHRLLVDGADVPGRLRFAHALIREVLLDDQTSLGRARIHLRVADAIEARGVGPDEVELLAEHLYRATPAAPSRRAAEALEAAAQVAVGRTAYAAAEDLLGKAVTLRRAAGSSPTDREAELTAMHQLLIVARALRYFSGATSTGELDRAKQLAQECGRDDVLYELLWFECAALATAARVEEYRAPAQRLLELTSRSELPEVQVLGVETYAVHRWSSGRIREAAEQFDRAVELIESSPEPTSQLGAELRVITGAFWITNHALAGDLDEAAVAAIVEDRLRDDPDPFTTASLCGFMGSLSITLGWWDLVQRFSDLGLATDEGGQFRFWHGQMLIHRALHRLRGGDLESGLALFHQGVAGYTDVGGFSGIPLLGAAVAEALLRHGEVDRAAEQVQVALADMERSGERWGEPFIRMVGALVCAAQGDHDGASVALDEVDELIERQGSHGMRARVAATRAEFGI